MSYFRSNSTLCFINTVTTFARWSCLKTRTGHRDAEYVEVKGECWEAISLLCLPADQEKHRSSLPQRGTKWSPGPKTKTILVHFVPEKPHIVIWCVIKLLMWLSNEQKIKYRTFTFPVLNEIVNRASPTQKNNRRIRSNSRLLPTLTVTEMMFCSVL